MKNKKAAIFFFAAVFVLAAGLMFSAPGRYAEQETSQLLVKFYADAPAEYIAELHKENSATLIYIIPRIDVQVVQVPARELKTALERYQQDARVEFAEVDAIQGELAFTPNDTFFGSQWGMTKIDAETAWDITHGSSSVKIAILDYGIDQDHPDLASKIVANADFTGSGTVDDLDGHGTHIAGIAAAVTDNGFGVAGVGYDSSLMNGKVLAVEGGSVSWVVYGMMWAVENGASVISISYVIGGPSLPLQSAVNNAWNAGVVVVAAAGNSGTSTPTYPGYYSNAIAVAATTSDDQLASFSSFGDWVSVAAPGVGIYSTLPGGVYGSRGGTSMAAPHVAGLAALLASIAQDTDCDGYVNDEIRTAIESSAVDISALNPGKPLGYGRIDAAAAVAALTGPCGIPTVDTLSPADNATSIATNSNLVITFSEAVDAETGNINLYKTTGDELIQAFDVTTDITGTGTTTITADPTSTLDSSTDYYVKIDATAFDDTSSNSYAGIANATTWNFTTADEVNPTDEVNPSRSNGSPSGALFSGTTQATISLNTDENATCKYSTALGTSYSLIANTFSTTGETFHSQAITGLSDSNTYTYYIRCQDDSDNLNTNVDDYSISFSIAAGSGSGIPAIWYNPPKEPEEGFSILINNNAKYTDTLTATLNLFGGSDTTRMAISNFSDFRDAEQEDYQSTKSWNLCKGLTSCSEGESTVYAKFYTSWGTVSLVVSNSIVYRKEVMTISRLKARISEIILLIQELEAQLDKIKSPSLDLKIPVDYTFKKTLKYGDYSTEVQYLQIFLNLSPDTVLAESGAGSPGNETKYFGALSKSSVISFQNKYASDILTPLGLTNGTGFVGFATIAKINEILGR